MQVCTLIDHLPREILSEIMKYLSVVSLGRCASVCHNWKILSEHEDIWKNLMRRENPGMDTTLPSEYPTLKSYFPHFKRDGRLMNFGLSFLESLNVTSEFEWTKMAILFKKEEDKLVPQDRSSSTSFQPSSDRKITEAEFASALRTLGTKRQDAQGNPRTAALIANASAIYKLSNSKGIPWDGHTITFVRDGQALEDPVVMILHDSQKNVVHSVKIDSTKAIINSELLKLVLTLIPKVEAHDDALRDLMKRASCQLQIKRSSISFKLAGQPDALLPFQVIATYSPQHATLCWAWANSNWTAEQSDAIVEIKRLSKINNWPEANALHRPVIDCELALGFMLVHIVISRMNEKVFAFSHSAKNGLKVFLALCIDRAQPPVDITPPIPP
eukprot:TRINITY_DN21403_c0_g1_i1.p1 TRINITY_DN21403_c0_g1~~TRINITY_DN21403_c0_g1_i1.p1  ORF type:complete len:386 (+),score=53.31 TRINITY_DN21403_c0_g1_i1:92-1249(+)